MTTNNESTPKKQIDEAAVIRRLSLISILGNALLSAFKIIAGIFGHSGAMISDAIHSFSDVLTTIIAYIGVKISKKEADRSHPYGHERIECVASLFLGLLLAVTETYQKKSKFYKKHKNKTWYQIISWAVTMQLVFFGFFLFSGKLMELVGC